MLFEIHKKKIDALFEILVGIRKTEISLHNYGIFTEVISFANVIMFVLYSGIFFIVKLRIKLKSIIYMVKYKRLSLSIIHEYQI